MVVLSAQDSHANINKITPELFLYFPNIEALAASNQESLYPFISKVKNFGNKAN
jgi:endonuclease III